MNNITSRRALNSNAGNTLSAAPRPFAFGAHTKSTSALQPIKPGNKENDGSKFASKFGAKLQPQESKLMRPSGIPIASSKATVPRVVPLASSRVPVKRSHTDLSKNMFKLQITPKIVPKIDDIDKIQNFIFMTDYAADIYKYLRELEVRWAVPQGFMKVRNPTMAPHHRAVIVDWIFRFDRMFEVSADTFHITTSIFDRFVYAQSLQKSEYQLVAVTCFLIACKFEEVYFPTVNDLVSVCENLYSREDFLRMEVRILSALSFDLGRPHALHFLRRYSRAGNVGSRIHMMAKFFVDLSLCYHQFAHIKPSMVAGAALYLSLRLNAQPSERLTPGAADSKIWTPTLEHYSTYTRDQLSSCIELLASVVLNSEKAKEQECRRRFSHAKCYEVSKLSMPMKKTLEMVLQTPKISPK